MLYDSTGNRKYLTSCEREAFIAAANRAEPDTRTFGLTIGFTGARISEVLAVIPNRIDFALEGVVLQTLKRRRSDVFRTVPIPQYLLECLEEVHSIRRKCLSETERQKRIWPWCRTTAWSKVKHIMMAAGITRACAMPKGLLHGLAVEGTAEARIPLNIMQKWLGHARIETTAIYANAVGREERALAERLWGIAGPPPNFRNDF